MADTDQLATDKQPTPTPPAEDASQAGNEGNKGDLNIALSRERERAHKAEQEASDAKAELDKLQKEQARQAFEALPEDEKISRQWQEFATAKAMSEITSEDLASLPDALRQKVEKDPFILLTESELSEIRSRTATTADYYTEVAKQAAQSVKAIAVKPASQPDAAPQQPDAAPQGQAPLQKSELGSLAEMNRLARQDLAEFNRKFGA